MYRRHIGIQINSFRPALPGTELNQPPTRNARWSVPGTLDNTFLEGC
jgi:hypothetical protein